MQYNLKELKKSKGPLPEDVNSQVEEIVAKFGHEPLLEALKYYREKKLFGQCTFYGVAGGALIPLAVFNLDYGAIPSYKIVSIDHVPFEKLKGQFEYYKIVFLCSILNRKITLKGNDKPKLEKE